MPTREGLATPANAEPLLVDLRRVATLLSISAKTAKRMAAAGELPGLRRVRRRVLVSVAELRNWIARGCPDLTAGRR
jgi:excisionase family DNA binding protein